MKVKKKRKKLSITLDLSRVLGTSFLPSTAQLNNYYMTSVCFETSRNEITVLLNFERLDTWKLRPINF